MLDLAGRTIGSYKILDVIGHGGMADVYRAVQPSIGREVAVKILPAYFLQEPTFVERFAREVQIIASLQHPHILPVYDFGEEDDLSYIVMAYMSGGTLADRIRREGGLPLREVSRLVEQIAGGLDFAHEKGIIHRDFKPSNVLLDEKDNVYLADFGIAKITEGTAQLTGSGVVGTPAYMAPELSREGGLTALVDVYALGATLFEMLTGRHPYHATTPIGLIMAHIGEPIPDVRRYRPDLPDAVQRVVEHAMAKEPYQRSQSPGALAAELKMVVEKIERDEHEDTARMSKPPAPLAEPDPAPVPYPQQVDSRVYASSGSVQMPRPRKRRRARPWIWIGGLVVAAGIVIGGLTVVLALWGMSEYWPWEAGGSQSPEPPAVAASPEPSGAPTVDVGMVPGPTPSPTNAPDPDCPGALAPRLEVGGKGRVSLSESPSTLWAEPNKEPEIAVLGPGTEFEVLRGPVCVVARGGHLNAWLVRVSGGISGWISEGYTDGDYWIEPLP
ncbi:MAG: serine/threonine protein kinase [Anaerolineae bacterium]|nr:serine/threonine protein kinase [Anaerolineae bacterium]